MLTWREGTTFSHKWLGKVPSVRGLMFRAPKKIVSWKQPNIDNNMWPLFELQMLSQKAFARIKAPLSRNHKGQWTRTLSVSKPLGLGKGSTPLDWIHIWTP